MRRLPSSRGCQARLCFGPKPSGTLENEASRAGLRPEGVYVYAEWSQGRANRPFLKGEHGCPKQSRTLEGKPAQKTPEKDIQKSAKIGKILTAGEGGKMV